VPLGHTVAERRVSHCLPDESTVQAFFTPMTWSERACISGASGLHSLRWLGKRKGMRRPKASPVLVPIIAARRGRQEHGRDKAARVLGELKETVRSLCSRL
jgi:hypothetical protein